MTLPYERRRALEWAGETLQQIRTASRDEEYWDGPVPEKLRELVVRVLRHYPTPAQIRAASMRDDLAICAWIAQEPEK